MENPVIFNYFNPVQFMEGCKAGAYWLKKLNEFNKEGINNMCFCVITCPEVFWINVMLIDAGYSFDIDTDYFTAIFNVQLNKNEN